MMPGKVFEIGFPKTGTTSLCEAARYLGLKATHTLIEDGALPYSERPAHAKDLLEKWLTDRYDFDVVEDYDYIGSIFFPIFREIDRQYPSSRFILPIRDPDSWLGSVEKFTRNYAFAAPSGPLELNIGMVIRLRVYGLFTTYDEKRLLDAFNGHIQRVMEHFDGTDRLLVMDVCSGDGWDKLCPFLGVPVPDVDFPHTNRTTY